MGAGRALVVVMAFGPRLADDGAGHLEDAARRLDDCIPSWQRTTLLTGVEPAPSYLTLHEFATRDGADFYLAQHDEIARWEQYRAWALLAGGYEIVQDFGSPAEGGQAILGFVKNGDDTTGIEKVIEVWWDHMRRRGGTRVLSARRIHDGLHFDWVGLSFFSQAAPLPIEQAQGVAADGIDLGMAMAVDFHQLRVVAMREALVSPPVGEPR